MGARLLFRLRKDTNGAVVADMEDRGVHYVRSYGVSQHTVRSVAKEFAPDHGFAKYLWEQPIRELKLAAVIIAEPEQITIEELKFWLSGADNNELAENLASFLLARTQITDRILELYGQSPNLTEQYAAILSAARGNPGCISAKDAITCAEKASSVGDPVLLRAAGLLLSKAAAGGNRQIIKYINSITEQALLNEIIM